MRFKVYLLRSRGRRLAFPRALSAGFSTLAFRLRGFERVARGASVFGVVQEWHCELP
jgi:hypothetical protein